MTTDKTTDVTNKATRHGGLSAEDAKLDALLKAARPVSDAAREAALLDRIMAAAEKTPRLVSGPTAVAPVAPATAKAAVVATTDVLRREPAAPVRLAVRPRRDFMMASGLLAASLVAGLLIGQMPYAAQTVTRIEQVTGFTLASASDEVARASSELDEDEL
jgi:hypothetical protein